MATHDFANDSMTLWACMKAAVVAAVLVGGGSACSDEHQQPRSSSTGGTHEDGEMRYPQGPPVPEPLLWFNPMDGTTDVGETPLRIEFDNSGMPVGEQALIDDVAQAAHLEGPGGEAIPFTYDVVDADGSDDHTPAYVEVHPSSDLEDTCYSLWLDAAPSWAAEPTYPAHVDLKDRGPGVRFCVGSRPVISFFRICESDGELKVIADFSERMEVRAGLDRALKPSIDGQGCAMVPLIADQASYGDLHYDCGDGVLAGELVVQASEPSSLVGLSGVRLRSFPIDSPLDWRFSVQELPQWGANCWIARPGSAP